MQITDETGEKRAENIKLKAWHLYLTGFFVKLIRFDGRELSETWQN